MGFLFKILTHQVLKDQINNSMPETSNEFNTVIAYEPIWAIGTGLTPTIEEIEKSHNFIRNLSNKYLEGVIAGKSFYSGKIEIQKGIKILKNYA